MAYTIEDLGHQVFADTWLNWRYARHPKTGAELMLGSLANSGFMVIDPKAQQGIQVTPSVACTSGWAIGQAPDGSIYQAGFASGNVPNALLRWNWEGTTSTKVMDIPARAVFTLDVAPDGCVYLPDYGNTMYRYNPAIDTLENLGDFKAFGDHIRNVYCAQDGLVYVTSTDYTRTQIVCINPATGEKVSVSDLNTNEQSWQYGQILKDGAGRVLIPERRWGRTFWWELVGGKLTAINQQTVQLAQGPGGGFSPLAFSDGSYVEKIDDDSVRATVTYVDATGESSQFTVERQNAPTRIFSVQSGGGKVWGGTFIPLTLFSHDPETGQATQYGNPTTVGGEIYSMLYSHDKLFMASYTGATLTRYAPGQPWRRDNSISANPAHLGEMKDGTLKLHRPYGKALDAAGNVYFAARGSYGCRDSGICRIDPVTEEVTRWIYPNTTVSAMTYLPQLDQLLVAERRDDEEGLRFTFVSPRTGEVQSSEVEIADVGQVNSWLHDGSDWVYGLHDSRATLFAYSLSERKIVASMPEMRVGDHCHECLLFGPDGDIWGLTNRCVYGVTRDLKESYVVAEYEDHARMNFYRFGMVYGPDGNIYFPNGINLMRVRVR